METLYRKVTFEISDKNHDEILLIGKSANFIFNPNTRNGEELSDFLAGCEEVPDNKSLLKHNAELREWKESSMQIMADLDLQEIGKVLNLKLGSSISEQTLPAIKKLKADKVELLEALEKLRNHYGLFPENRIEIESLIQKMKKCQENTPR